MDIQITAHNLELTDALRTFVNDKFSRLHRFADNLTRIQVTLTVDKITQSAEATVHMPPKLELHAHSESHNMYESIDALIDKLSAQLKKHKEKMSDH